jgi:hypothetical protein
MIRNERPAGRFVSPGHPGCQAFLLVAALLAPARARAAAAETGPEKLRSPDGRIEVTVSTGARLTYDVSFDGKPLLAHATLAMDV